MLKNKSGKTKIRTPSRLKTPKKRDRESLPRGAQGKGQQPSVWFRPEAQRWYILLGLSAIISILLFPTILTPPKRYSLGDVANLDIKASREFLVENRELTEKNRQEAVKAVPPVYDFDPTGAEVISRIKKAFESGREFMAQSLSADYAPEKNPVEGKSRPEDPSTGVDALKNRFFEILDIPPDDKLLETFIKNDFPASAEQSVINLDTQVFDNGVVSDKMMLMSLGGNGIILHDIRTEKEIKVTDLNRFNDLKTARAFVMERGKVLTKSIRPKELARATLKLAASLIKPNLTFNKRETELRKDQARKSVKPFYFKVKKGEMLIREGERVTPSHLLRLSEQYKFLKQKELLGQAPAMAVLIGFLLSAMYLVGLLNNRSGNAGVKDLLFYALTLLIILLVVIAINLVAYEVARGVHLFAPRALLFAIPVACGAMLITVFNGIGVAASFSLIISVLASIVLGGRVEYFIYFFLSSLVAASGVRNCRERSIFIRTGLKVSVCSIILALSIEALHASFLTLEALIACASAFIGGILAGILATGILPLIEMSFGYTTDIKLLELGNLDKPLLRDLMVQAPGTYHHCVIVSNMVEASAEAIGANPLLARVAAYYHDIGKMRKPLYFIENQANRENRHEKLAPSMSSLILISHVKDGVELAKEDKLGKEIIDIIKQHHGTSLISFFYEKAKEHGEKREGKSPQVKEEDFRYPGPRPQTKEAGLIMLADIVEAASRTLVDPTAARIQGMVQKIINKVFSDGQLNECELTLKDLHEIAKSFNKTLSGIFHHRIDYPEPVSKTVSSLNHESAGRVKGRPGKKGINGNTDQVSTEDSGPGGREDKAEAGESLKRLGLS
ncbi:MAG: HDIG domain-containing protein [Desulfobacteraceae bacterium]|nr:HDIG domain-containing protein [Desulfobacteraceae bacterium]